MKRGRYLNPPPARSPRPTLPVEIVELPRKTPLPAKVTRLRWTPQGTLEVDPTPQPEGERSQESKPA